MNVILLLNDGRSIDITEYLDDEADIELSQELERRAFQRTVDDVTLKCSNLGEEFSEWLSPASATSRMPGNGSKIIIKDGDRILFRGEIERPIHFDINSEWVTLDCFSMTKQLFDLAKSTRVSKSVPTGHEDDLFTTVQDLIQREVSMERFGHLINGYQISDDPINGKFASRQIRFWGYTADPSIGNNGRYKDLDPTTTVDELLKAMTVYYNADIFIDPETELLVMQKRNGVLNDLNHQLDDQVEEDDEFGIQVYDEGQVDYLALAFDLATPSAPVPTKTQPPSAGRGLDMGRYKWVCTYVYRNGIIDLESNLSAESDQLAQNSGGKLSVYVTVPLGPPDCTGRNIYRTKNGGIGRFYLAGTIGNNSDTFFVDETPNADLQVPARDTNTSGMVWLRYDEEAGIWDDLIIGDALGLNVPIGDIFDLTPHLRFLAKPFGYGQEIAAIYSYDGSVRVRTKNEHGYEYGVNIKLNYTNCVPSMDGNNAVAEVYDDKVTFKLWSKNGASGAIVPGTGGTVIRWFEIEETPPTDIASEALLDVFAFFGNEKDRLSDLQEQWKDLFLTKKRVAASVQGIGYRVGDSASFTRTYNGHTIGRCVIKNAKNNLTKERTKLELLTI